MIKRYDIEIGSEPYNPDPIIDIVENNKHGEWVKYEDHINELEEATSEAFESGYEAGEH